MKVCLIYLAAGNSRRFGSNKLLYELDGKAMYLHLLERLVRICSRHADWEVLVVTQYEEIMRGVEERWPGKLDCSADAACDVGSPACDVGSPAEHVPVHAVYSPDSVKGASWTVRKAVEAAGEREAQACAFFVADQPYLTEESAEHFLETMEKETVEKKIMEKKTVERETVGRPEGILGCVSCNGRNGNPVWFSEQYFPELRELEGDQGGRVVLRKYPERVLRFPVEREEELKDIDKTSCISERKKVQYF